MSAPLKQIFSLFTYHFQIAAKRRPSKNFGTFSISKLPLLRHDNGIGINGIDQPEATELGAAHGPGCVDGLLIELAEFGKPVFYVFAFSIVSRSLRHYVKVPVLAGVIAHAGHISPVSPVAGYVVIH